MPCSFALAICLWLGQPMDVLTPGAIVTNDKTAICSKSPVRAVSASTKAGVYWIYGITNTKGYVIDHLIPLEIGGANVIQNLWPQLAADAARKDRLENRLHKLICNGSLTPAQAQSAIVQDWAGAYRKYVAP